MVATSKTHILSADDRLSYMQMVCLMYRGGVKMEVRVSIVTVKVILIAQLKQKQWETVPRGLYCLAKNDVINLEQFKGVSS